MNCLTRAFVSKSRYTYAVAAALTILGLCVGMAWGGIYPFGDFSLARYDAIFQYTGFIGWLSEVLRGNGNIAYSFAKSLGGGTISLYGFILSSPFNLLAFFFAPEDIPKFLTLLYFLKLVSASLACLLFIRARFEYTKIWGAVLAAGYSLAMTNFTAGSNIMWLDAVYMLPLVCLGLHKLITEGKFSLLFFSVALSILFNWYSAYMVCLYSIPFFFVDSWFCDRMTLRPFVKNGLLYALTMVLALLASMVLFFPVIKYMLSSSAVEQSSTNSISLALTATPSTFLGYLFFSDNVWPPMGNLPMSGLILLLSTLTLFVGSFRKKVTFLLSWLFFYLSTCWPPLSLVWTGFMRADSFMPRFGFIIIFTLVFFAVDALVRLDSISDGARRVRSVACSAACVIAMFIYLVFEGTVPASRPLLLQLAAILVYGAFLVLLTMDKRLRRPISVMSCCVIGLLFAVEQGYEIKKITYANNNDYSMSVSEYEAYIADMSAVVDGLEDGDFFRIERVGFSSVADRAISLPSGEYLAVGMRGLSHYSSATQQPVNDLLGSLGYCLTPGTRAITYYNSPILATDSILGIRYLLAQDVEPAGMDRIGEVGIGSVPGVSLYENPRSLSVGFEVPDDMESVKWTDNVFTNQEAWVSSILGRDVSLYRYADAATRGVTVPISEELANAKMDSNRYNPDVEIGIEWELTAQSDGPLYCSILNSGFSAVFVDGRFLQTTGDWEFDTNLMYLGDYREGDRVTVALIPSAGIDCSQAAMRAASLMMDDYSALLDDLSGNQLAVTSFSDGQLSGEVSFDDDSALLLTIPYEEGWQATVNGEDVAIQERNGLMYIPVEAGESSIQLQYTAPGQPVGLVLSGIGVVGFCVVSIWKKGQGNRHQSERLNSRGTIDEG